jgi:hypothetical protein
MGLFVYLNQRYQQQEILRGDGQCGSLTIEDPHHFVGNSPKLAPHGAPANPKWQTKFSSGLTGGIKQDQLYTSPLNTSKPVIHFSFFKTR